MKLEEILKMPGRRFDVSVITEQSCHPDYKFRDISQRLAFLKNSLSYEYGKYVDADNDSKHDFYESAYLATDDLIHAVEFLTNEVRSLRNLVHKTH